MFVAHWETIEVVEALLFSFQFIGMKGRKVSKVTQVKNLITKTSGFPCSTQ
jgi:hypothetical protein